MPSLMMISLSLKTKTLSLSFIQLCFDHLDFRYKTTGFIFLFNFLQTVQRNPNNEFLYEYEVEIPPDPDHFNAFFVNVQFTGYDNRGWFEFTSEIQFSDSDIDPFPECHGTECKGEMV